MGLRETAIEADSVLRIAIAIGDSLGDRGVLGWSRLNLGLVHASFGDLEQASRELGQAVLDFEIASDQWGLSNALLVRVQVQRQLGELAAADS